MTSEQLWSVSARLLGVYLIVEGALYATGALSAAGMGLPDGSNRLMFILAPIFQAVVSIGAGALLVNVGRRASSLPVTSSTPVSSHLVQVTLQLLGVYYLVDAFVRGSRLAVEMMLVTESWHFRAGALTTTVIGAAAAAILIAKPDRIAAMLNGLSQPATSDAASLRK